MSIRTVGYGSPAGAEILLLPVFFSSVGDWHFAKARYEHSFYDINC